MGTISQELLSFKNSIAGKLDVMNDKISDITSSLSKLSNVCNSSKSEVGSYYDSANKDLVLSSFDSLSRVYSQIQSSVEGTLSGMISQAASLFDEISKLEEINKQIEKQQSILNSCYGDDDATNTKRSNARRELDRLNKEFDEAHEKALSNLSKLKGMDGSINIEGLSSSGSSSTSKLKDDDVIVEGGVFRKESYTAENGTKVNYYIYIPKVSNSTEKLPILVYFHGIRDTVDRHHGLGELLLTKKIEPPGIVILPQALTDDNVHCDEVFHKKYYQDAVIELAYKVADKYNGDKKKLSVSGHSDGGTTAYQIVNGHPGVFSACAPISGVGNTDKGIQQTKLWVFQGEKDSWVKPNVGLRVVLKCENRGCDARHYVYKNQGHEIQTMVYEDTFDDGNGNKVKLIDWLMSQELSS